MPISLAHTRGTDIFRGEGDASEQGVRLTVAGARAGAAITARLDAGEPVLATADSEGGAVLLAFVPQGSAPGATTRTVVVTVESGSERIERRAEVRYGEPGWTLHLAPHFHFDPVWWNTQAAFISEWETLPVAMEAKMVAAQMTAFDLMHAHLDRARTDPDYCFVVAELDYLKPWWDSFPRERAFFRQLLREGRLEVTGGSYNEPSTTLVSTEATIRNAISGLGFQRSVLGSDPRSAWMLDVFGHDPHFPAVMADAGLTSSSWARGPFHEWGPMAGGEGVSVIRDVDPGMQFDQEFEWMAPSGKGLLTSFQAAHYHAGWWMDAAETLEDAEAQILQLFEHLATASATKHVLLLVGTDHVRPNRWVTEIHRHWAEQYTWPRFVVGTPSAYFAAVNAELGAGRGVVTTQTRDMNPVFGGTAVSFIDTKQAHRAAEVALVEAEKFAALAWARGLAPDYPEAEIDLAWRQLAFASHHDAITGSESDQVYIDLLGMWRGAWSAAREVRATATRALVSRRELSGDDDAVTVFNGMSSDRTDVVRVVVDRRPDAVRDADGAEVPSVVSGDDDAGWVVEFVADVPATGYATFGLASRSGADSASASGWTDIEGATITNEHFAITIDPDRGGTVSSLRDLRSPAELITPGAVGNEILVDDEYPDHPEFKGLGPWHIAPRGHRTLRSSEAHVDDIRVQRSAAGERVIVSGRLGEMAFAQTLTLWAGQARVDAVTRLDFSGTDQLVRIAWPCRVPGSLPVAQVGAAVIGRGYSHPDVDTADFTWVMDSTCHEWFGLSAPVRLRVSDPGHPAAPGNAGRTRDRAIAVAEIVSRDLDESADAGRTLARALVRCGVTSTNSLASGPRYGDLDKDSNQPDFRIAFGTAATNPFIAEVLAGTDPAFANAVSRAAVAGHGMVLVPADPAHDVTSPGATVAGARDLPVLILSGDVRAAVAALVLDLDDAVIDMTQDLAGLPVGAFEDRSIAMLNRGTPGYAVDPAGTLYLSALRSCTGWPSGVWINPPTRTAPDGSAFQLQHWSHSFEYAVVAGEGDWRNAGLADLGQRYAQPFTAVVHRGTPSAADARASLLRVEPSSVRAAVVKRTGNPLSFPGRPGQGTAPDAGAGTEAGTELTVRVNESLGRDTVAVIDFGDLEASVAHRTDLLEGVAGDDVLSNGRVELAVGGFDLETVRVGLGAGPLRVAGAPAHPAEFSRYWLHNTGPAPLGNQPVSVRIHERASGVPKAGVLDLDIQLAAERPHAGASGRLRVKVGGGGRLAGPGDIDVPEIDEVLVVPVTVLLDGGGATVSATFLDPGGHDVYDAVAFDGGGRRLAAVEVTDVVTTRWDRESYEVRPGHTTELALEIHNPGSFDFRGELFLLTPWGTWTWLEDWATPIEVPATGRRTVSFTLAPPAGTDPSETWAMAKMVGLGSVMYTETVPVIVRGPA